jgi:hypothetical protein
MIRLSFEIEPCAIGDAHTVDFKARHFTRNSEEPGKGQLFEYGPWPSSYGIPGRYVCLSTRDACIFVALTALRTINNKITKEDLEALVARKEATSPQRED